MSGANNTSTGPNPFDPAALRLDPSYVETVGVKKVLTTVPVRKPGKQEFIRVHPDPAYRLSPAGIIELKAEREAYLVTPLMARALTEEIALVSLRTAISRQGVTFLWPVKLPDPNGRQNQWHDSAAEAVQRAEKKWVRVKANMDLAAYEVFEAIGELPEPEWPDEPFKKILEIAFRGHVIDAPGHPLIKRLRGEE